ncbi:helix-turn-helix transcriptional regulator [Pseudomonas vancouverensis]|uniref:LuxR family transcriptional regulator n=1 Tax=Pseudomonas vancouverensis TaxID=95300 RepID=A0A1H2MDS1_PSEVA|nr:LuxR C-terminal-related transcriptional regulator [Pseudomonas vancouverensis]KAB0499142.1 LuxR family transcriptional regulator [Pseudomonas vancouverensis]TDB59876.1 LuxR family transcriptional regulator [Pseudomonas vancouverensis]SDU91437.1 regulatory protein, luxR family [Pseudomonas vancouverensis]
MDYWQLRPFEARLNISSSRAANILARMEADRGRSLAMDLLSLAGKSVPLAQCTIFTYSEGRNPELLSFADHGRNVELARVSGIYTQRFFSRDGNRQAIAALGANERIIVQRQSIEDIADTRYRHVCYEQPRISERLALLSTCKSERWLSVNFYRGREHGALSCGEIDHLEALAPVAMQVVRLHHQAYLQVQEMPSILAERVASLCPNLTARDKLLLRLMLAGSDSVDIAHRMGVQPSSAATYIKRLYRKVGVSGLRELLAVATQPLHGSVDTLP